MARSWGDARNRHRLVPEYGEQFRFRDGFLLDTTGGEKEIDGGSFLATLQSDGRHAPGRLLLYECHGLVAGLVEVRHQCLGLCVARHCDSQIDVTRESRLDTCRHG